MVNFNNAKNGNDVCTDLIISVFFQSFSDENLASKLIYSEYKKELPWWLCIKKDSLNFEDFVFFFKVKIFQFKKLITY